VITTPVVVDSLRQRIVDEAITLTIQAGWAAVTMGHLADAVGVSRQTVYNEVGTKSALAESMIHSELTRFLGVVEESFDAHPDDAVAAITSAVRGVLELAEGNTLLHAIVSATHGADTELLPLLTTHSEELIAAASFVMGQRMAAYPQSVGSQEQAAAIDMIVRVVLSHVMQPGGTPQDTGAAIGAMAQRMLYA
jgi:AcrR family transcriptional regulator